MKKVDYLIIGAGFAGSVVAERVASQLNKKVLLIDKRHHIGGNCYDYTDENGILVQKYGPHIFHTKNEEVFNYLSNFTKWNDYEHKVFAFYNGEYYSIPINLDTVNKFYRIDLKDEEELKEFLETIRVNINEIKNSRDVVVVKFGEELYEAFVKHYTKKQWDVYPDELDKSVLSRLPIKYDKCADFFPKDPYQGMPVDGFGNMFEDMLIHRNIEIELDTDFSDIKDNIEYDKLIYTGRIDQFFDYKFGELEYRCINFTFETLDMESYQPNSVVNHPDIESEYLRVTEFKKFYDSKCEKTVICKEIFNWDDTICYPVMTARNFELCKRYEKEAKELENVIFVGRLAQYKYINMDQAVEEGLKVFEKLE